MGDFDNKAIILTINSRKMWGKGIWRLNNILLELEHTKVFIRDTIKYYQRNKINTDPLTWWDNLKKKMKEK